MTIKKYEGSAGGWGALFSTTKHLVKSENVSRNIRNLLKTNQDKGFDCPGCAWGESKEQTRFRFCENGAKPLIGKLQVDVSRRIFSKSTQ